MIYCQQLNQKKKKNYTDNLKFNHKNVQIGYSFFGENNGFVDQKLIV